MPVGTQVVLRVARADGEGGTAQRGSTGRVSGVTPDGKYEVRLVDGRETVARRDQLSLRAAYQDEAIEVEQPDGDRLVREHTIYAAVVGSRAFGLDTDSSDTDTRGVYVAPTESFWSLAKPPTHVDGPEPEWSPGRSSGSANSP